MDSGAQKILTTLGLLVLLAIFYFCYQHVNQPDYLGPQRVKWDHLDQMDQVQFQSIEPGLFKSLETRVIQGFSGKYLNWMTREQFQNVEMGLSFAQLKMLDGKHFGWVSIWRLQNLDSLEIQEIPSRLINAMQREQFETVASHLGSNQRSSLSEDKVQWQVDRELELMTLDQIQNISIEFLERISDEKYLLISRFLAPIQILQSSPERLTKIPAFLITDLDPDDLEMLTIEQLKVLPEAVIQDVWNWLKFDQIRFLDPQWRRFYSLGRLKQLDDLEIQFLKEDGFTGLDTKQIRVLESRDEIVL